LVVLRAVVKVVVKAEWLVVPRVPLMVALMAA